MTFGMEVGFGMGSGTGRVKRKTPYLITGGYATSNAGAPTMPTVAIGDLCIAALLRTGSGMPALPAGWFAALAPFGNAAASGILCWQFAAGTSVTWPDFTNNTGRRYFWGLRDAEMGPYAASLLGLSGTALDYPALNGGLVFSRPLAVLSGLHLTVAQTDVTNKQPTVLPLRQSSAANGHVTADTLNPTAGNSAGVTYLNSFAAESRAPLDTAAAKAGVVFTVQGKLAA